MEDLQHPANSRTSTLLLCVMVMTMARVKFAKEDPGEEKLGDKKVLPAPEAHTKSQAAGHRPFEKPHLRTEFSILNFHRGYPGALGRTHSVGPMPRAPSL